nr:hypothetical protein [Streptococcus pyogenes]
MAKIKSKIEPKALFSQNSQRTRQVNQFIKNIVETFSRANVGVN